MRDFWILFIFWILMSFSGIINLLSFLYSSDLTGEIVAILLMWASFFISGIYFSELLSEYHNKVD